MPKKDKAQIKHPTLIVTKDEFHLWSYEQELIPRGGFVLFLFFLFCIIEFVVFPASKSGRLLPWFLAFFYVIPFLMLAIGRLMPAGADLFKWRPGWDQTSSLRRWFRIQYTTVYGTLAILSYLEGNLLCALGFAVLVPVFITYTWLLESQVRVTENGIATFTGVLTWKDISEVRLFVNDRVLVLTVSNFGRYLIPYAIYHVPKPWKTKAAIETALGQAIRMDADKVWTG